MNRQASVVALARAVLKHRYGGTDYGRRPFPAWERPLSTAGLVAESSKRLAAGREHVVLSSLLPWEAFAAGGGRDFAKNPGTAKFLVKCSYKDFLLLSCELLAYNSGHLTYLRYFLVSCIPPSL